MSPMIQSLAVLLLLFSSQPAPTPPAAAVPDEYRTLREQLRQRLFPSPPGTVPVSPATEIPEKQRVIAEQIAKYLKFKQPVKVVGPLTIRQVEMNPLQGLSRGRTCVLPAITLEDWDRFKNQCQEGDEIYFFTSDLKTWQCLGGREGYAVMRKNGVIAILITALN